MLVGVIFYFLLVCVVLALVFLPPARTWAVARASRVVTCGRTVGQHAASSSQRTLARAGSSLGEAGTNTQGWFGRNARWLGLAVAVIVTPPLIALALRGWQELGSFDHTVSHTMNSQVAELLRGEQLVPPPPLPPELFMTREVEQARPLIRYASRQWELLDDDFRKRLLIVYRLMREKHGYEMVLLEGYRSPERQAQLASLGPTVTRATAYRSYHQHGLAADSAFRRDGRIVIAETDAWAMRGYELYGEIARSVGLTWGGGWSLQDFGHTELRRPGVLVDRGENRGPTTAQEQ
jgi:peptidoglycan LD-endopeptidase CwlK